MKVFRRDSNPLRSFSNEAPDGYQRGLKIVFKPMSDKHFYDFDGFRIDAGARLLLRDGQVVSLTQKAFDVLVILIERRDRIVTKDELMSEVWPDTFVEEGNLSQNIYTLRKVLGETPSGDDYIKTVPRRGYRFAATVNETWEGENARDIPTSELRILVDLKKEKLRDLFQASDNPTLAESNPHETSVAEISVAEIAVAEFSAPGLSVPDHSVKQGIALEPLAKVKPAEAVSRSAQLVVRPRSRRKMMAIGAGASLAVIFSVAGWLFFRATGSLDPFRQMSVTNLTNTGNISSVAISPDGKYVAYGVIDSPQRSSLWITQLGASTSQQIIPPAEVQYFMLTFTPDGRYIYYVTRADRTLYRIPILGGPSKKILEQAGRGASFSPDGSQFVFHRHVLERRQVAMFIANSDGSGEKEVASIDYPENFEYPSWSPDGKWIICAAGHSWGGKHVYVVAMRVGEWKLKQVSAQKWRWIGQIGWLPDSTGLLMVASDEPSASRQVWSLSYPGGEAKRITNDSASYVRMSLSSDARSLVALQQNRMTNVWLLPSDDASRARQLTFGAGGFRGRIAWAPDGKLVYDSEVGEAATISIMDSDGSHPKNLLGDLTGRVSAGLGTVTPDGRYIIYYSDLDGGVRHIWRMNIDGGNPIQLTNGSGEDRPSCSPDGRWVVYTRLESKGGELPTVWKVSIDGGSPVQLTNTWSISPAVSPDSKLIACIYSDPAKVGGGLALIPIDGGKPLKIFPPLPRNVWYVSWTPDGRGLVYAENPDDDASRLWVQPLDGGPPRQFARFENDQIFGFDWSRDGTQMACVRGLIATNAVLIKDFKAAE